MYFLLFIVFNRVEKSGNFKKADPVGFIAFWFFGLSPAF